MILREPSWIAHLGAELEKKYMKDIYSFLASEKKAGKDIYPDTENIFRSLELCSFENTKVVILGQDPYHGAGQAHGLSFSVQDGIKIPPSLRNIYKELENEGFGITANRTSGNLEDWAKQGVLLLNSVLTVESGKPASHSKIGWQQFTDQIIKCISSEKTGVVFLLWGAFAISKSTLIDSEKHLILTSPHPSPFSAHKGFFGNNHFLECNNYLEKNGNKKIDW